MPAVGNRFDRLTFALIPASIVIAGCGASLLPHHAVMLLVEFVVIWISVSVPIGVLAGHCMLGESDLS